MGGSSRQRRAWTTSSCPPPFGPASRTLRRHCSLLKVVRFLAFPSPVVLPLFTAGFPGVPRFAPWPSVAPSSSLFTFLPVWPSPRRPWPPPCSVRECGSVGSPWICLGKCTCPCLLRSRRPRLSQCCSCDLDIGIPDRADDRRLAAVPWGPDCSRHDSRFCLAQGWDASSSMCERGWSRTGSGPTPQRTQVPELAGQHGRAKLVFFFWPVKSVGGGLRVPPLLVSAGLS